MKEIFITGGHVAMVDDDVYPRINKRKWKVSDSGYAIRVRTIMGESKLLFMHREIMKPPNGLFVDHINGDKLDNRKENLRIVTHAQNMRNRKPNKNSKFYPYKGVKKHHSGRFQAQIRVDGKHKSLGLYDTVEDAAKAYNRAALFYFGEYACLNEL